MKNAFFVLLALASASAHASLWEYSEATDKMTGKTTKMATSDSDNSLSLPFPYQGPNKGRIIVRQHPQHGLDVIFKIDKGQLMCRSYSPCKIAVKFGDAKPVVFNGSGASDQDTTIAFLSSPQRFIDGAAKTQNILVQFDVYNGGTNVLEFSFPAPLEWGKKAVKR
jgi:hypothetical protein